MNSQSPYSPSHGIMFFQFFKKAPELPGGWDLRHLWSAQCLIASVMMENVEEYGKISESSELFENITKGLLPLFKMDDQKSIIPDADVRKLIENKILQYLETEIDSIKCWLAYHQPELIKPIKEVIIEKLRSDPVFSNYIKSQ